MIALILGTSEGKKLVSLFNEFTDELFITTATAYGGELLKNYKYKILNTNPLGPEELKDVLARNGVTHLVDASHPYAVEITKNARQVCKELNIEYIRYERPSIAGDFSGYAKLIQVKDYEELGYVLKNTEELQDEEAVILDTCGSKNIEKLISLGLKNRIIHRVLPSVEVMKKCLDAGIRIDDVVAIKGPVGYELNLGFIREYKARAIIMKDSGVQGGSVEKIRAAIDSNIYIFVLVRKEDVKSNIFTKEEDVVEYLRKKLY